MESSDAMGGDHYGGAHAGRVRRFVKRAIRLVGPPR
jgi:hypothetical protein